MTSSELEQLADMVATRLSGMLAGPTAAPRFGSAKDLAAIVDRSPAHVIAKADQYGGFREGSGPKAPWRFPLDPAQWPVRSAPAAGGAPTGNRRPARQRSSASRDFELLPVKRRP